MKKFFKWVGIILGIIIAIPIISAIITMSTLDVELTQEQKDSIALVQKEQVKIEKEAERLEKVEQLKREIASLDKGVDFSPYRESIDALQLELILFSSWASIINEAYASEDNEMIKLADKLKSKVVKLQIKEFPILRKCYVKLLDEKLWEHNIDVTSNGGNYKTINITGSTYASNKNIKETQTTLSESFHLYRFTQSRYRWYEGADEYQYYTINSKKDSELIQL